MANVIDSLVIQLGLDGRGVAKGAQQASKSLDQVERSANKAQGALADSGKAAADGFSRARTEALALLAVFTGGRTLKAFTSEITRSNAELGYMAQRLDMDPRKLYQMQRAVMAVGGSAQEVGASFQAMQQMMVDPAQAGNMQRIMSQLGVTDYADAHGHIREDILKRLNRSTQGMDQGVKNSLLSQLGIGQGEINLIDKTTAAFDELQAKFKGAGPTDKQIKDSQKLLEDWIALTTATEGLGRAILGDLTPALDAAAKGIIALEKSGWGEYVAGATIGVAALATAIGGIGTAVTGVMAIRGVKALLMGGANIEALRSAACGCECKGGVEGAGAAKKEAQKVAESGSYLEEGRDASGSKSLIRTAAPLALPIAGTAAAMFAGLLAGKATNAGGPVEQWAQRRFGDNDKTRWFFGDHQRGNAAKAMSILRGMGYSRNAALGIVGNIAQESRFDPNARGDGGSAYGLGQWHSDRVEDILKGTGIDVQNASFEDQVRAYAWELKHGHDAGARKAGRLLEDASISAADATHVVRAYDERPANKNGMEDSYRYALAQQAAQSVAPSATTTNTTEVHVGDVHIHANTDNPQQLARDFHQELRRTLPLVNAQGQT